MDNDGCKVDPWSSFEAPGELIATGGSALSLIQPYSVSNAPAPKMTLKVTLSGTPNPNTISITGEPKSVRRIFLMWCEEEGV